MHDRVKIFEQAKDVTVKKKLFFIADIICFLPCATSSFYEMFPADSEEMEQLKHLLESNRSELKVGMRKKWYESNAPALQIALYRLTCTDEERKMLSMTHTDVTTAGEPLHIHILPQV